MRSSTRPAPAAPRALARLALLLGLAACSAAPPRSDGAWDSTAGPRGDGTGGIKPPRPAPTAAVAREPTPPPPHPGPAHHPGFLHPTYFYPSARWLAASGSLDPRSRDRVHHDAVTHVAFSPDSAVLATADSTGRVLLQTPGVFSQPRRIADLGAYLTTLTFAPDGRLLTVAQGQARLWDLATGAEVRRFPVGRFAALTFTPDGRSLAHSDDSRLVRLLDATTGAELRVFGQAQPNDTMRQNLLTPSSVAFSPDGKRMAVARWDQDVHLWDVATGKLVRTLPGTLHVAWSPDGRLIAAGAGSVSKGGTDLRLQIWDVDTGVSLAQIAVEPEARFSPDSAMVAALAQGTLHLWHARSGKHLARGGSPELHFISHAFSPDGKLLATGAKDGMVFLWSAPAARVAAH